MQASSKDLEKPMKLDFTTIPELETERMILRRLVEADAPALFELRSKREVMQYICRPLMAGEDDARALMAELEQRQADGTAMTWCMCLKEQPDELIGLIGLYRIKQENLRAEVGYTLSIDHWGNGLMSEALQRLLTHAFNGLGFHSLDAYTDPRNQSSKTLLERNGFRHVGTFRDYMFFEGSFYSSDLYELLNQDWTS